ncbi:TPA: hypothetical protein ACIVAD_001762, partial [Salmonella enterica subsp. enterica serovar Reading]
IKVIADHFLSFKYNQNVTFRYLWIQINRVLRQPVPSSFSKWGKLASRFRETTIIIPPTTEALTISSSLWNKNHLISQKCCLA